LSVPAGADRNFDFLRTLFFDKDVEKIKYTSCGKLDEPDGLRRDVLWILLLQ